jgi:hypothetical protein
VPDGFSPSNRRLVQRFAAHLAHLLNDPGRPGEPVVTVQAFALFTRLTATLERRDPGGDGGPYDGLTGLKVMGPGTTPQEAALFYVEQVVRRALHLARDEPLHRGHIVFLALCRRGIDPAWPHAELARMAVAAAADAPRAPADFAGVAERLGRLSSEISDSNPAKSTRAAAGPLFLHVAGATAEVAEEMSLWDAITSAPLALHLLAPGTQFGGFCSDVIKALEAANARYGTLITLGLSPRDWQDLSVNTAKKISAFLSAARAREPVPAEAVDDRRSGKPADERLGDWERAWEERRVPGFASAKELWDSELGRALRRLDMPRMVEHGGGTADIEEAYADDDTEAKVLERLDFERMVERGARAGVLSEFDAWFLRKLSAGETIEALAAAPEARHALPKGAVTKKTIEVYTDGLRDRIAAFARSLE